MLDELWYAMDVRYLGDMYCEINFHAGLRGLLLFEGGSEYNHYLPRVRSLS